jgi:putative transcriptional regulator
VQRAAQVNQVKKKHAQVATTRRRVCAQGDGAIICAMSAQVLTGHLLVASPALSDPNFDRSVVLMLEHNDESAVGVVLNRPSTTTVHEALPQWGDRAADPPLVFVGGPVNPSAAICIAGSDATEAEGFRPLFGRLGTLDLGRDPDDLTVPVDWLRVFAGYAGWSAGQLEGEIEAGAWFVLAAEVGDATTPSPELMWHNVLRRQSGLLAAVANIPTDLSVN